MASPDEHKRKIMVLRNFINNANRVGNCVSKEKLIAECGKKWGTARQTAQSYIKELLGCGDIKIEDDDVWLSKYTLEQMEEWEKENSIKHLKDYVGEPVEEGPQTTTPVVEDLGTKTEEEKDGTATSSEA